MNYLSKAQYRADKTRLTRAINSGDPAKVIVAVRTTVAAWNEGGYAWPDDWHRWGVALRDAQLNVIRGSGDYAAGLAQLHIEIEDI